MTDRHAGYVATLFENVRDEKRLKAMADYKRGYDDGLKYAAVELANLRSLLRRADSAIVWESTAPYLGRGFQDEVELALSIEDAK